MLTKTITQTWYRRSKLKPKVWTLTLSFIRFETNNEEKAGTNLSSENNLLTMFHFRPDDNWNIQLKRWQVIFRAQIGNR